MNRAFAFDMYLLTRFQRVSHWVQRQVGWKSEDLTYATMLVAVVFAVAHKHWILVGQSPFDMVFIALNQIRKSRNQDVLEYDPVTAWVRIMIVLIGLTFLVFWESSLFGYMLGWGLSSYFRSCNDLPESKSKVRQWFESLSSPAPQRSR